MNQDLFLSILAMDSYNRGYGQGVLLNANDSMNGQDEIGRTLGLATITTDNITQSAQSAGFYGIAYDWNGQRVISYRGTNTDSISAIVADITNGWTVGAGSPAEIQAYKAIEFFNAVRNGVDPRLANITLTGHSLGGGLAGLVATLHGKQALLFDHMPFETAALTTYLSALDNSFGLKDLVYDGQTPWFGSSANINAYATEGEILSYLRSIIATEIPQELSTFGANFLGLVPAIDRHSQALTTILLYGQKVWEDASANGLNRGADWQQAAQYVLPTLFDLGVGDAAGAALFSGVSNSAAKLQTAIAYSAISEGERPFGDTGIIAMFDDADDLGKALNLINSSQTLRDAAGAISQAIVEYAGKLALGDIEGGSASSYANGILQLATDQQSLAVDFSGSRWTVGATHSSIVGRDALMTQALSTLGSGSESDLAAGMNWTWGSTDTSYIQRAVFQTTNASVATTLPDSAGFPGTSASIFVAGDGNDVIHGSQQGDAEVIAGGAGNDQLFGEGGNDILVGGAGNDVLIGGAGQDFLAGGAGDDTIDLELDFVSSGVSVTLSAIDAPTADQRGVFQLSYNGDTDAASDIEHINLTGYNDAVAVNYLGDAEGDSPLGSLKIDFGGAGTPSRTDDMLDFSNAGVADATTLLGLGVGSADAGVYVDLSNKDNQTVRYYYNWGSIGFGDIHTTGGKPRLQSANANSVKGTGFDDVLIAQSGTADHNEGYSTLYGGGGNDELTGGGWESHLYGGDGSGNGGSGADTFNVGSNTFIEDGESGAGDAVYYADFRLTGGVQKEWQDSGWAYSMPMSTLLGLFPAVGSSLVTLGAALYDQAYMSSVRYRMLADGTLEGQIGWGLGGSFYVKNYDLDLNSGEGVAGLTVWRAEHAQQNVSLSQITKTVNLALYSGFGHGIPGFDPLVLDLNGNGYDLVGESASSTYFEFDTDGFGEHTGWVRPTDGFLVRDTNGNGTIDSVAEMFGNATTSGFAALSAFDSNSDGVINASDTNFATLKVWQDADQDGVTDAGELKTLGELGIASISLNTTTPAAGTAVAGNAIMTEGIFTRTDGTTGKIADVALTLNETNSKWLGDSTVSGAAAALPQLNGYGELKDLRVAMTGDAALLNQVSAFATNATLDLATLEAGTESILYKWAGVDSVASTALGSNGFDARKLAFLEKYTGYELMPRDTNGVIQLTNIADMEAMWDDQLTRLTLRLSVQGPLASTFSGITYDTQRDLLVASSPTALEDVLHNLLTTLSANHATAITEWANWAPLVGVLADGMVRSDAAVVRGDYVVAQLVAAMDGVSQPLSLADLVSALAIPNVSIGTSADDALNRGSMTGTAIYFSGGGNDVMTGGTGQDVYIFGRDIGQTVINDTESNESGDRIRFALHNRSEVDIERSGNDLLITVIATGETVRVTGQFAPVQPLGGGAVLSPDQGIEDIQFADGTIMELPEIMTAVGTGTSGDDTINGTMHSDVLIGGLGNDVLKGGDDGDIYVFNRGEGTDIIQEVQSTVLLRAADMLILGDTIAPDEVSFSRSGSGGDNLLISIANGGGSVLVQGQFGYTSLGYTDPLAPNSRIEAITFREYGDSLSWADVQAKLIAQATTSGADTTRGFGGDDIFNASAGSDTLIGMDGQDSYRWDVGSGNDVIDEQSRFIDITVGLGGISLTAKADTVEFGAGINPADLVFSRPTGAPDLIITNSVTGETLTVKNQFAGFQTGVLGAQWMDRVEWFAFSDGSRLSWQDVLGKVTVGGAGNDQLWGDLYADHMEGKAGDDILHGKGLGDTYMFNVGDGHDTLADDNSTFLGDGFITIDTTPDILQLGAGITIADISFARTGNGADIDLIIGTSGDRVTLAGQDAYMETGVFGALSLNRIEEIDFADGTVWDWQQLNARVLAASITSGNDTTTGFTFDDDIAASAGNDILAGRDGADTYRFAAGSGQDIIRESVTNVLWSDDDRLVFAPGIAPADVTIGRNGNDLIFNLASGDSIRIENQFAWVSWYTWNDVEHFDFADGTSWTTNDIQQRLLQSTAGNDTLTGFSSDDVLDGGAGNDILAGYDGSDIYKFGLGYGSDTIQETVANANLNDFDRVQFGTGITLSNIHFSRTGNDLYVTVDGSSDQLKIEGQFNYVSWFAWNDIEKFEFTDGSSLTNDDVARMLVQGTSGDDHLIGTFGTDLLDGGAGNDLLEGGDGADRYIFGRGYGQDVIQETVINANLSDDDRLEFGPNLTLSDLGFARSGNDLIITINGTSDSLRLNGQFDWLAYFSYADVDNFLFADGSSLTQWDVQNILISAQETSGNDTVTAFKSDDILDGGAGNDILYGGDGADIYRFGFGSGKDIIREEVTSANLSDNDMIEMGAGISANDIIVTRVGNDMEISLVGHPNDTVKVEGQFNGAGYYAFSDVEGVKFADGTVLSKTDLAILTTTGTNGNDTIVGTNEADIIVGRQGDDILQGGGGEDVYRYTLGDGKDFLDDFVASWGSYDTLELHGITPESVTVSRSTTNPQNMALSFTDGGSIELNGQVGGSYEWGIDNVTLDDGTQWSGDQLAQMLLNSESTSGADTLNGSWRNEAINAGAGDDIINPGNGNDTVIGGGGDDQISESFDDDTYVWNLGDGNDLISWGEWRDGWNRIQFGSGISASDLRYSYLDPTNGGGLKISVAGQSGSISIDWQLGGGNDERIDQLVFADGSTLNRDQFVQAALNQIATAGNDNIWGSNLTETVNGGAGNDAIDARGGDDQIIGGTEDDTLWEGGGNDTYVWNRGDGNDIIRGHAWWDGYDTIQFGSGIAPTDVTVSYSGNSPSNIVIAMNDGSGSVTIEDSRYTYEGVDRILFADGTSWDKNLLLQHAIPPATSGNDVIPGSPLAETLSGLGGDDTIDAGDGNDILIGGTGNDTLHGDSGDDLYRFNLGDGQDVIEDHGPWNPNWGRWGAFMDGGMDTLEFGSGIAPADILVIQPTADNLILRINGTTDQMTLVAAVTDSSHRIETIRFADGTTWAYSDLATKILVGATDNGDVVNGTSNDDLLHGLGGDDIVSGGAGNDTLLGDEGNDQLLGEGGNDILRYVGNLGGFDSVDGGAGTDTIIATGHGTVIGLQSLANVEEISAGGFSNVSIAGSAGDNVFNFSAVTLTGIAAINGGDGNDTLTGTATLDIMNGDAGNDIFTGGAGDDILNGGEGNDLFKVSGTGHGYDAIVGSNGTDTIQALANNTRIGLTAVSGVESVTAGAFTGVYVSGSAAADTLDFSTATLTGITRIDGGSGNDMITGSAGADVIRGSAGDDIIWGSNGNDTIQFTGTGGGYDSIEGGLGADTISALANGTVIGLKAVSNVETISAGAYTGVYISGSTLADILDFSNTTLTGIVRVQGGNGNDIIAGSATGDTIQGDNGNDTLNGGDGNDRLTGGANNDTLNGGNGDDTLIGGANADTLTGGAGVDHFLFDILTTSTNKDTIADFVSGVDKIDIDRAVFAAFAGDPAGILSSSNFFVGSQAQTMDQHIIYNAGALYYDPDGSGASAQVQIAALSGTPTLTTLDFVLI